MRRSNLATKLAVGIGTLIAFTLITMGLSAVTLGRWRLREHVLESNVIAGRLAARGVEQYLSAAVAIVTEAGVRPKLHAEILAGNWSEAGRVIENIVRHFAQFEDAVVLDGEGVIRARYPHAETVGQSLAPHDFFNKALASNKPSVSAVYQSAAAQHPVVAIAVPVVDKGDGKVKAVLAGVLSLPALSRFAAE